MKKRLVMIGLATLLFVINATAQTTKTAHKKATTKTHAKTTDKETAATLSSTSSNNAYAPSSNNNNLRISDPTINTLNMRAEGANVPVSKSGIVGMPKRAYGFANGHILLRSTSATSSGTAYGSGAVGTGTSIQGVGTSEVAPGVNGKSPYAGPGLWGEKRPIYYPAKAPAGDSTRQ